jgi:hypothetical protein
MSLLELVAGFDAVCIGINPIMGASLPSMPYIAVKAENTYATNVEQHT